jgi:nitroreductase
MEITEAIRARRSTRAFLDRPVEGDKLERLLSLAAEAPSAINLQPWELTVVTGEERKRLSRLLLKRMRERRISCAPGAKRSLPEAYVERERGLLQCLSPGLPPDLAFGDFINEGSCDFYGAPVAIVLTLDDLFSTARLVDMGILAGYLVLAAHALGLGTCPIGLITAFEEEIRETLNLSEDKKVVLGIAVGYAAPDSPLNRCRSERAPLEELVRWREG